MVNPRCFLDFQVEGQPLGRVIFELFADVVPRTAENFRALTTGSKGVNELGIPLYMKGAPMHRIIAGFMVQGGDFTLRNGKGGESIYGPTFEDEDLRREVDEEGLLVMANKGKNTNSSQFFVTLRPCPHLNGKHVVFGKVVKGFEVIQAMSKLPVDAKDRPLQLVTISHCGELERKVKTVPKRAPSPTPSAASDRSRSRSRSRSVSSSRSRSPSPARKRRHRHRSDRSRSNRDDSEVEEGSDRERSSSRRRRHRRDKKSNKHRSSKKRRGGEDEDEDENREKEADGLLSPEEIAALEKRAAEEAEEEKRRQEVEARLQEEREREAAEKREQREREMIANGGVVFKGRGAMKAPGENDAGRRGGGGGGGGMRGW
ncbi:uncharacterized protein JCM6883_001341 [Sporobolomyces salmoneus]|uniref:uncharacterized protein n=1 Tax=Sporobolomyces salmoneus TaxID=183962 RepID=UPI00316BB388